MRTVILLAWTWLLAAGTSEEAEPGACLLQHGSVPVRASLIHESTHGSAPVRAAFAHDNRQDLHKIHKGNLLVEASTKRRQDPAVEGQTAPHIDEAFDLDAAANEALRVAEEQNRKFIKDNSAEKPSNQADEANEANEANEADDLDTRAALVNEGTQDPAVEQKTAPPIDQANDLDTPNNDPKLINGANDVATANDADESAAKPSKEKSNENEATKAANQAEGGKEANAANTANGANEAEELEKEDEKKEEKQSHEKKENSEDNNSTEKPKDEEKPKGHDDKGKEDKKKEKGNETEKGDEKQEEAAPGASLRLELWLPIPINDLKSDKKGPMSVFLDTLQGELARVANVSTKRFDMLGVRGEYADDGVASFFARDVKASLQEGPVVAEETAMSHSIVDLEVLPATQADDLSPADILKMMEEQLAQNDSTLMKGPMKDSLVGAKVVIHQGVEGLLPHDQSGAPHRSSRLPPLLFFAMVFPPLALLLN